MSDLIRQRVVVTGQVQGVFFRDTTRREAGRLGVSGWVCNRRDGAVEAVFEGPADAVGTGAVGGASPRARAPALHPRVAGRGPRHVEVAESSRT